MSEVSASSATGKTTQTFLTALITNSVLLTIEISVFILLKNRLSRIYTPRTYLPPPEKRAEELPKGPWKWLPAIVITPAEDVIRKNGLDAYMMLRFLRLMILIFGTFTVVTWLILLPVDTAGIKGGQEDGLNRLSWGNIPSDESTRYAAHIIIVYLLTFWVIYLIRLECFHYTHMRQAYLASKSHSHLPQARTVLITSIPHQICSEKELKIWASFVPGGVQNIWVYRDTKDLNKAYEQRLKACQKLETATSKLLRSAIQAKRALEQAEEESSPTPRQHGPRVERMDTMESQFSFGSTRSPIPIPSRFMNPPPVYPPPLSELERGQAMTSRLPREKDMLDSLVPHSQRPRHRLGFFGLWGRKVDTIKHYKHEISKLNTAIGILRRRTSESKPLGSAFVQCNLQLGAHVLAQCVSYHEPMKMSYKWIQVAPKDVIWANIDDGVYETRVRYVTSWLASIGIIVLWFFPVTFVGLLSNISELCVKIRWLTWVCRAPTPVPGIIQGVLPPLLLSILFAILPWVLRGLAWYENIPLYSLLSISVYKRYYLFLVVHGFLVVTLSSGITATASDVINSPTKTVSQLASHLPDASVFFLTWTVTQGLTGAGSALLQVATLFMHYIRKWFFGRTPRQAYAVTFLMPSADFGTVLPQMSLLATIGLAYSVLSPIINGLATLAFVLFYLSWKFLLTWVFDQPDEQETGGLYFPIAIQYLCNDAPHALALMLTSILTVVGLYIEQVCLAALFFLKISSGHSFLAQGILMLVLIVITITAQVFLKNAFDRA
ncbi:DUF221-domain-containing protein [Ramaria rubella]|nr:DUF221-domain-containing protein [Ramaria rubella]